MRPCLFASDLHGKITRYSRLFETIESERPAAVFLGGDLLPGPLAELAHPSADHADFITHLGLVYAYLVSFPQDLYLSL